jgi:hypothetical protein
VRNAGGRASTDSLVSTSPAAAIRESSVNLMMRLLGCGRGSMTEMKSEIRTNPPYYMVAANNPYRKFRI